mmetsp:Transcript_87880/g.246811  ORF Transcript_87880/g.246811 Transcript_87880/m.246811 type:complete len:243 (-) Transcript_87880:1347-2075(-)
MGGAFPSNEKQIITRKPFPTKCSVRETVYRDGRHGIQMQEQRVDRKVRHKELALKFGEELFRKQLQKFYAADGNAGALVLPRVLEILLDANGKGGSDLVLLQIPPKVPKLFRSILMQAADLRQGSSNAADQVREPHQPKNDDGYREEALDPVLRLHVHGGRRELRDRPVERCSVLVNPVLAVKAVRFDPGVLGIFEGAADDEPNTTNEMVDCQEHYDHFRDVREDADVLRDDEVAQAIEDLT